MYTHSARSCSSPFYEALEKIGININTAIFDDIMNEKNGTAYIKAMTHTFLRGTNFEKKVVIIDEGTTHTRDFSHELVVSTVSENTEEQIRNYIKSQKER